MFNGVTGCEAALPSLEYLNERARKYIGVELLNQDTDLTFAKSSHRAVDRSVERCFRHPFDGIARLAAAANCDLVVVSGKPSELPAVKELLRESLAMPLERIIFASGFNAGQLWPFNRDGKIDDAKQVTVVGAALHQAIASGLLKGLRLDLRLSEELAHNGQQSQWGPMPKKGGTKFRPPYLDAGQEKTPPLKMLIGTRIGRKLVPNDATAPEPVYELRWRDPQLRNNRGNEPVEVVLGRTRTDNHENTGGLYIGEGLEILEAKGVRKEPGAAGGKPVDIVISKADLQLKLNSLQDSTGYWLDTGRFEVLWPDREDD